ncbi:MAG TPA: glycosyltransferase family 2 protein [Thermoanaerobaculia bacterium]
MAYFSGLSIVFPMWNEEAGMRHAVAAAREACESLRAAGEIDDWEIVIVDDASTDATGEIAGEMAAADPHIRVAHHAVNRKLGGSIRTGLELARHELILYSDADLPFDLGEAAKACRLLRMYRADIVSAYRHDRTGEGVVRAIYSHVYNWLVQVVFGLRIRDVNFAFKLCRRRVFEHVRLESEGSFIDAELIARASRMGFRVIQFGVDYFPRTRCISTLSSFAVIRKMLREMVAQASGIRAHRPLPAEWLELPDSDQEEPASERARIPPAVSRR